MSLDHRFQQQGPGGAFGGHCIEAAAKKPGCTALRAEAFDLHYPSNRASIASLFCGASALFRFAGVKTGADGLIRGSPGPEATSPDLASPAVQLIAADVPKGQQPLQILLQRLSTGESLVTDQQSGEFHQIGVFRGIARKQAVEMVAINRLQWMALSGRVG